MGVDPSPWEAPHPVSSTASTTPMQTTRVLGRLVQAIFMRPVSHQTHAERPLGENSRDASAQSLSVFELRAQTVVWGGLNPRHNPRQHVMVVAHPYPVRRMCRKSPRTDPNDNRE